MSVNFVKDLPNTREAQHGGYFSASRVLELLRLVEAPPGCPADEVVEYVNAVASVYEELREKRADGDELAGHAVGVITDLLLQIERLKK